MLDELLIRWTVRLALLCYAFVLADALGGEPRGRRRSLPRLIWTIGCGLFVAHVVAAFHFRHEWSHEAAFQDTAHQTQSLLGWEFGGGVYFNYLFTLLWVADVAYWWRGLGSYASRHRLIARSLHGFMLFMVINGAIVFEAGPTRWVGLLIGLGLALTVAYKRWVR